MAQNAQLQQLRNELTEKGRALANANRRAWALQTTNARLETRNAMLENRLNSAPTVEYNVHTLKGGLSGVRAMLTIQDMHLSQNMQAIRKYTDSPEFIEQVSEGSNAMAAFDAMNTLAKILEPRMGIVECAICMEPISAEDAFIGKSCQHIFHLDCAASCMQRSASMPCPFRCKGIYSDAAHCTLLSTANDQLAAEGSVLEVAEETLMTPEQKFQHKVDEELVHVRIKQVDETIFEVAEEGRRAATTKRALEEEGKEQGAEHYAE
eukprot:6932880-Prymnesium_polylepis.2